MAASFYLRSPSSAKILVVALRSFLRYLEYKGLTTFPLDKAVPAVAGWALSSLPKHLAAEQVQNQSTYSSGEVALTGAEESASDIVILIDTEIGEASNWRVAQRSSIVDVPPVLFWNDLEPVLKYAKLTANNKQVEPSLSN
jgi:hypothetical protein